MRIASVHIQNFRSLRDVKVEFDEVTTFVGPNGVGKSTVLRALDWVFNGAKDSLTAEDIYAEAGAAARIRVRVTFDQISESDRVALGEKYAPSSRDEFTIWRTWGADEDKITARAMAFPQFESVRVLPTAADKRARYNAIRSESPDLALPPWSSVAATEAAMGEWERANAGSLAEAEVSDSHFFGFHGQGKLAELFDFVFVAADLRAYEESMDGRGTIVGRILAKVLDTSAVLSDMHDLAIAFSEQQAAITSRHLGTQLDALAQELTNEVSAFTLGRQVYLSSSGAEIRPQTPKIQVSIQDQSVNTEVHRQGHGFQRALLLASLKVLSRNGTDSRQGAMCLAIEEPELYQHPTQARALAAVLRSLASLPDAQVQIAYATHSPHFVDPRYFDQVRRLTRKNTEEGYPAVAVRQASLDAVCERLRGFVEERSIRSRWDQVCLKQLAEAFFADGVILVEGDTERAILEGAVLGKTLAVSGVTVASAGGKPHILLPYAILEGLGINTLLIFDNDSGVRSRMTLQGKSELDIGAAELNTQDQNRRILGYFALGEEDFPTGVLSQRLIAIEDNLEVMIAKDWPEWEQKRAQIVADGRGVAGKHMGTYGLAAEECVTLPGGSFLKLLEQVSTL